MTNAPANPRPFHRHRIAHTSVAFLLSTTALVGGCGVRKKPAISWSTAILVKPVAPTLSTHPATDALEDAPNLQVELTPPPRLTFPRSLPPRPRVNASSSSGSDTSNADVLLLAPQLSVEETGNAQRETSQSIAAAENNLAATRGRALNAMQADLASKIRGFIADAKDAGRVGDWDRARSLAKKAQVLSQELVSSF